MTPEEENIHKEHTDKCSICKKQADQRMIDESASDKKGGLKLNFDTKTIVRTALQTGIMGALLLLAFNVGQLQSFYTIDYYNNLVQGGSFFTNEPTGDYTEFFDLNNFNKTEPVNDIDEFVRERDVPFGNQSKTN